MSMFISISDLKISVISISIYFTVVLFSLYSEMLESAKRFWLLTLDTRTASSVSSVDSTAGVMYCVHTVTFSVVSECQTKSPTKSVSD